MPEFSCCAFIFQKDVGRDLGMGKGVELAACLGMMLQGADHFYWSNTLRMAMLVLPPLF